MKIVSEKIIDKKEIGFLAISIIVVIISIIIQKNIFGDTRSIIVGSDISDIIITSQATIITLVFAILTIITKTQGKYYRGIEVNNYILNTRPFILKYKIVIFISFLLVVINIILDVFDLDVTVFGLFLANILIISYTIWNVVDSFFNVYNNERSILKYIKKHKLNTRGEKRQNYLRNYFYSLKDQAINEDTRKELHDFLFGDVFDVFFASDDDSDRKLLEGLCNEYSKYLFDTERNATFIDFIKKCYENASSVLYKKESKNLSEKFDVFSNNGRNINYLLYSKESNDILKRTDWNRIINDVSFVSVCLDDKEVQRTIPYLGEELGRLCSKNSIESSLFSIRKILESIDMIRYNSALDNKQKELLVKVRSRCLLRTARSLIMNGRIFLIEKEVYDRIGLLLDRNNADKCINEGIILLAIELHMFVYYAAFYEEEIAVNRKIKKECKEFLGKANIINNIDEIITFLAYHDKNVFESNNRASLDILNNDFFRRTYEEMDSLEVLVEGAKEYVIEDFADDYTVFLFTYIANAYENQKLISYCFDTKKGALYYYLRYSNDRLDEYRRFFYSIEENEISSQEQEDCIISDYSKLIKLIEDNYKKYTLEKVRNQEKKLDSIQDGERGENEKRIKDYLNEQLLAESRKKNNDIITGDEILIHLTTFSDMTLEEHLDHISKYMKSNMAHILYKALKKDSKLNEVNMKKMEKDEYLEFLENNKGNHFVGSSHKFGYDNKYYDKEVDKLLNKQSRCLTDANIAMIVYDNQCILVEDVSINIRKQTIDDLNIQKNPETNLYEYNTSQNTTVNFTEEELEDYLKNARRILEIKIRLRISKSSKGVVIVSKDE